MLPAFKWISMAMTLALGIAALFSSTYREDSETKRRTLTRTGKFTILGLVISFFTSVLSMQQEGAKRGSESAAARTQIEVQTTEIATLRKIALSQREFAGMVVTLEFTPQKFNALLNMDEYSDLRRIVIDPLVEDQSVVLADGVVKYYSESGLFPPTPDIAGPEEPEYQQFRRFVRELCSQRFALYVNTNVEVASFTTKSEWPSQIAVEASTVTMTFKPRGLRLDDFDGATADALIELDNPENAPKSIKLFSLDRHIEFKRPLHPEWKRHERDTEYTDLSRRSQSPTIIYYLESNSEPLVAEFQNVFPKFSIR